MLTSTYQAWSPFKRDLLMPRTIFEHDELRWLTETTRSGRIPDCRDKPALVCLAAGYKRVLMHGAPLDWALELVPPPREQPARRDT